MSEFDIRQIKLGEDVTAEAIHEDLEFLDDWEERYRYIIDLGKQLPAMPEDLRTEERFVRGCQSCSPTTTKIRTGCTWRWNPTR